ncbi:MAG TPA: NAD(P)-dependent oxidoreductase [Rubrobacter sp.]|nr:NAD(P)-dependent oxidoreductase [Rubrobacter sp.]
MFSLKRGWHFAFSARRKKALPGRGQVPGAYGSTVGLVSLGMVGRLVRERLRPFDLRVAAYDPYVTSEEARVLGVDLMSLEDLFASSEVVSLHAPLLPETEGMILGSHLASMKWNAALINTSRGAVVREAEMIEVLEERPDLWAVLDVTAPNLLSRTPASTTCPTWCSRPTSPVRRVASAGAWAALSLMSCADTWRECPSSTRSPGRERP